MGTEHVFKPVEQQATSKTAPSRLAHSDARQATLGSIGTLRALQRSAGNRATVGLLRTTAPTVQRIVFWDETVTPNTIESITLDRLGGTGGGAHTTSYQLFLETVQNAVIGQQYDVAIKRLMALCKDVKDLPGYLDDDKQRRLYDACEDTYDDAILKPNTSTNIGYFVETLATDYVKLRNGIEYNYLKSGEGDVGGFSEPANLKAASLAHQAVDWPNIATALAASPPSVAEQAQINQFNSFITAAANLLDTRNVKPQSGGQSKSAWIRRWKRIIQQHIATIMVAHPGIEAAADTIIEHLVNTIGAQIQLPTSDRRDLKTAMRGSKLGWQNIEAEP